MLLEDTPSGGLYIIRLSDTHYYEGRARDFKSRWRAHLRELKACTHNNRWMQAVFDKHGRFEPEVFLLVQNADVESAEQKWIDEHFRKPGCVNLSPHSRGGCEGHTAETRQKMSHTRATRSDLVETARQTLSGNRIQRGGTKSLEARLKVSVALTGKIQSPESVAKRALANTGRKNTPATIAQMSESAKRRAAAHPTTHGAETRALISKQQRGRVWITNGLRNLRVFPDAIPAGWEQGRTPLAR